MSHTEHSGKDVGDYQMGKSIVIFAVVLCTLSACAPVWIEPNPLPGVPSPTWHGITIGVTMTQELPNLLDEAVPVDLFQRSKFPEGFSVDRYVLGWDIVHIWLRHDPNTQKQTVQFIIIEVSHKTNVKMADFVRPYGKPERVTYAGFASRSYIFATKGVAVDSYSDRVWRVEYFTPTSVADYLRSWGTIYPRTRNRPVDDGGELDPLQIIQPQ